MKREILGFLRPVPREIPRDGHPKGFPKALPAEQAGERFSANQTFPYSTRLSDQSVCGRGSETTFLRVLKESESFQRKVRGSMSQEELKALVTLSYWCQLGHFRHL